MIEHVWTVLCARASIDKETNNISLFEVVEQLQVVGPRPPDDATVLIPVSMELVTLWERTDWAIPTRGTARMALRLPDNQLYEAPLEMAVDLSTSPRHRSVMKFGAIPFRLPGVIRFEVSIRGDGQANWRIVAKVPLLLEMPGQGPQNANLPNVAH